jgi:A/G-specific adenine glycosylase
MFPNIGMCPYLFPNRKDINDIAQQYYAIIVPMKQVKPVKHGTEIMPPDRLREFRKEIHEYYRKQARDFPWRRTGNPYHILVSEIMLQQTQTGRVLEKYERFLSEFPNFYSLARAPLQSVLSIWQGLGYNRRAVALSSLARQVVSEFDGVLPSSEAVLMKLPGIGKATAAAIAAFAFNKPSIFIETNIRRVFIHFFFHDRETVTDAEILPLISKTLDRSDPRQWYYALMDYGAMLKKGVRNPNRKSAHYKIQSRFEGSHRQLRGMVLKEIISAHRGTVSSIAKKLDQSPDKIRGVLAELQREGFIKQQKKGFVIS